MVARFTQVHNALTDLLPTGVMQRCEWRWVRKGERLFRAGDKPLQMFYVNSGEVLLERLGQQGDWLVLQRVQHGFVAQASLESPRYHCDARVLSKTEVASVPMELLRQALGTDAAFALRWIGLQSSEIRRLRLQCERLSLHRVQDRLLHLIETEGQDGVLPLTSGLKSLAGQLAVTHEALYRCVASLEKSQRLLRSGSALVLQRIGLDATV